MSPTLAHTTHNTLHIRKMFFLHSGNSVFDLVPVYLKVTRSPAVIFPKTSVFVPSTHTKWPPTPTEGEKKKTRKGLDIRIDSYYRNSNLFLRGRLLSPKRALWREIRRQPGVLSSSSLHPPADSAPSPHPSIAVLFIYIYIFLQLLFSPTKGQIM